MRLRPALLALVAPIAIGGCGAAAGPAIPAITPHPMRVLSMNQCTDQLVLALLPPERIASVTWLSRDPASSLMAEAAARVPTNHGLAEEVVAQRPDLVVAGSFTTPATRGLLQRLGYPMITVDHAESIDDIRRITRQVAAAVGEPARGEALIARMDARFAALARAPGPHLRVAAWDGAGFNAGKASLYNIVLEAAGAVNVAIEPPATTYGRPDVEVLLLAAPTLLVKGAGLGREPGLRDNVERHPLVRRYWDGARTMTIRPAYYMCGTPMVAEAAVKLRAELRAAAGEIRAPLSFATDRPL